MFGFIIGSLSLVALIKLLRAGRHSGGAVCGRSRRPHHHGGRRRRLPWLHAAFDHLDTSPGQEKVIRAAIRELMDDAWSLRSVVPTTRDALTDALGDTIFDDGPLDALFVEQDEKIGRVRGKLKETLQSIHEALDDEQRTELTSWLRRSGRRGPPRTWGPYR